MSNKRVHLLDHGYVELIETWGSDERIIEAARMSTGKGFLGWDAGPCPVCEGTGADTSTGEIVEKCSACEGRGSHRGDGTLLRYLYENHHSTPFEMAGMVIEVQAPIFVFREWERHRTQSYNEMSARYTPLPALYYVPTVERLLMNSKANKQAGRKAGAAELSATAAERFRDVLKFHYEDEERAYQEAMTMGVPKEIARCLMPVGHYSRMRASANLRNWLAFLTLREDEAAQWEIRQYAIEVSRLVRENFPRTYDLYVDGRELSQAVRSLVKLTGSSYDAADAIRSLP